MPGPSRQGSTGHRHMDVRILRYSRRKCISRNLLSWCRSFLPPRHQLVDLLAEQRSLDYQRLCHACDRGPVIGNDVFGVGPKASIIRPPSARSSSSCDRRDYHQRRVLVA
jgi:hypothetical protein